MPLLIASAYMDLGTPGWSDNHQGISAFAQWSIVKGLCQPVETKGPSHNPTHLLLNHMYVEPCLLEGNEVAFVYAKHHFQKGQRFQLSFLKHALLTTFPQLHEFCLKHLGRQEIPITNLPLQKHFSSSLANQHCPSTKIQAERNNMAHSTCLVWMDPNMEDYNVAHPELASKYLINLYS